MITVCDRISQNIGALFNCATVGDNVRVRTPFLYPDGDVIDLYLIDKHGEQTLTDLGETMRWLRGQTITPRKSVRQKQLIEDICLNHGVEFFRGMLMLRVHPQDNFGFLVTRLSQAALRVADLWFTFRRRATETLTDDVEEFLRDNVIPFDRRKSLSGRSGREWKIDFYTRTPRRSTFIDVLSTGSRAASQGVVEHVYTAWSDLSNYKVSPDPVSFISLVDDTLDVWTAEQLKLLGDVSDLAYWSRSDELVERLKAA
ncbi:MAG: DUF1828 domain-containing protein [Blastocatellia bacterium]|nr:DUF1828 domain-containing protein [Blastocatellia bacterium]